MRQNRTLLLLAALAGCLVAGLTLAQGLPKPEEVVTLRVKPMAAKAKPGAAVSVTVLATIKEGFHINSNKPTLDYLIPTRVEIPAASGFALEKAEYPKGELKAFGFAPDEKLSVYEGLVRVPVTLRSQAGTATGINDVRLVFHYQACNDRLCLRPATRDVVLKVLLQ